jgi:hypothetical protein
MFHAANEKVKHAFRAIGILFFWVLGGGLFVVFSLRVVVLHE